jgi:protein disulfide-isomerase A1
LKILEKQGTIVRDFKGPRDAEGIVSYLKKQVGPPYIEITSVEQGRRLVEENDLLVVSRKQKRVYCSLSFCKSVNILY